MARDVNKKSQCGIVSQAHRPPAKTKNPGRRTLVISWRLMRLIKLNDSAPMQCRIPFELGHVRAMSVLSLLLQGHIYFEASSLSSEEFRDTGNCHK